MQAEFSCSPVHFRIPPSLLGRMDALAALTNLTLSDIVRLSLLRVLEAAEKDPAAALPPPRPVNYRDALKRAPSRKKPAF